MSSVAPARTIDPNVVLRTLLEATAAETGQRFFEALVQSLCHALDVSGAWVTRYRPEERRLQALAFWIDDRFVTGYEYTIAGTPCEPVISRGCLVNFPADVVMSFPADPDLKTFSAVSYMGIPLHDGDEIIGHLAVLDRRPMPEVPHLFEVFRLFADRAGAELRRLRAEIARDEAAGHADYLRRELQALKDPDALLGRSHGLMSLHRDIRHVSGTDTTVLVVGQTGTGKELVARAIHNESKRRSRPFITVNCAAVPAALVESEFFGHERGAFTGATSRRDGRFALADKGTLFLDEIGELPLELQPKLLRALQEGEFEPVGGSRTQHVDVRIIAATNRDLEREVREGRFREDLYYRLNVYPIRVPSLRDRLDDIGLLADSFARRFARKLGRAYEPLSLATIARLRTYAWPGNVRELQNVIERAMIASTDGRLDLDRALPETSGRSSGDAPAELPRVMTDQEVRELERANLVRAMESCGWRIGGAGGAARALGLSPSTLSSRLKAFGIQRT